MNALLLNIERLHTTPMGSDRIKHNLSIDTDPVEWCKRAITASEAVIERKGKNWYIEFDTAVITVNASSYTIITAHKLKE